MRGTVAGVVLAGMVLLSGCGFPAAGAARPSVPTPVRATVTGRPADISGPFGPIAFVSEQVGWVAESTQPVILHTVSGGRSWQREELPDHLLATALSFATPARGLALGESPCGAAAPSCVTAILLTQDGGRHWTVVRSHSYSPRGLPGLTALSVSPTAAYALLNGHLLMSADGGATWQPLPTPPAVWPDMLAFSGPNTGFLGAATCSALGACTSFSLWRTTDHGAVWTPVWRGVSPPHSLAMVSAQRGYMLTAPNPMMVTMGGMAGTLYQTTDGGRQWTVVQSAWTGAYQGGFQGAAVWANGQVGWIPVDAGAGPGRGGLQMTADGGVHWSLIGVQRGWTLGQASLLSPTDGWVVGSGRFSQDAGFLLHTTNGGRTWQQVLPPVTPVQQVDMVSAMDGFGLGTASAPNQLLWTANGGRTWSFRPGPPVGLNQQVAAIQFQSSRRGLALVGPTGGAAAPGPTDVYATNDGGATWHWRGALDMTDITAFAMGSDGTGLVQGSIGYTNRVAETSDGGRTFTVSPFAPTGPLAWDVAPGPDGQAWLTLLRPGVPTEKDRSWTPETLVLERLDMARGRTHVVYAWPNPDGTLVYGLAPVDAVPGADFLTTSVLERTGKTVQKPLGNGRSLPVRQTTLRCVLWVTHDGGRTWAAIRLPEILQVSGSPVSSLDFVNARVGFLLTGAGLYETQDGGYRWASVGG